MSFIDRNIMAILVGPIREEFQINDFQYGVLNGVAFSLLYTFLGIPIGILADRSNRKNIIAVGTAFWSIMTFVCGLASGFFSLFAARMGVGVGEAALSPPAHSLLSDYFSPQKLPTIMSIFTLGIPVGIGISYSLGGWVYSWLVELDQLSLPFIGALAPWQATFMIVGLPGLLLAAAIYAMQEPKRQGLAKPLSTEPSDHMQTMQLGQMLAYLGQHRRVYLNIFITIGLLAIVGYGFMMWFVEHMSRRFSVPAYELAKPFGMLYLLAGSCGTLFGAFFASWLVKRGYQDASLRVLWIVSIAWVLPAGFAPLADQLWLAQLLAIPCVFLLNAYFGVSIAALHIISPNQMRAQVSAVLLFMGNVFGLVFGPMLIGWLADYVFSAYAASALGLALAACGFVCCSLAAVLSGFSLRPYAALAASLNPQHEPPIHAEKA
ncbi:MAG: MFS transporter [Pseudomonadales bacterium]|nr:MFS transporter [Pseudomonadales bacterium]